MIPERSNLAVMVVFGGKERDRMVDVLPGLDARFQRAYAEAHTYHDGKWVLFDVRDQADLDDIMAALTAKRRPKPN